MSPVHRSNSNMDASGSALAAAGVLADEDSFARQLRYHPSYHSRPDGASGGLDSQSIQRSYSMPPSMFEVDGATFLASERGSRAGGQAQGSHRGYSRRRMLESQSEDELTTSGGREGDIETSEDGLEEGGEGQGGAGGRAEGGGERGRPSEGGRPRGRRNAFRGNAMLVRRATSAADGSIAVAAGVARRNVTDAMQEESMSGYVCV